MAWTQRAYPSKFSNSLVNGTHTTHTNRSDTLRLPLWTIYLSIPSVTTHLPNLNKHTMLNIRVFSIEPCSSACHDLVVSGWIFGGNLFATFESKCLRKDITLDIDTRHPPVISRTRGSIDRCLEPLRKPEPQEMFGGSNIYLPSFWVFGCFLRVRWVSQDQMNQMWPTE